MKISKKQNYKLNYAIKLLEKANTFIQQDTTQVSTLFSGKYVSIDKTKGSDLQYIKLAITKLKLLQTTTL